MRTTKHSQEICKMPNDSAVKLHLKYPVRVEAFSMGGTDSAFYSKKGLKATSVIGLAEDGFPVVWHDRRDTPERLDKGNLYDMLRLAVQFIEDVDLMAHDKKR